MATLVDVHALWFITIRVYRLLQVDTSDGTIPEFNADTDTEYDTTFHLPVRYDTEYRVRILNYLKIYVLGIY